MSAAAPSAPSSAFAVELLAGLIRLGARDVVVCPGSRSQALALAAAEAERAGAIRLHVRTDERSAAFFALGVARETGASVPVIVTSGTAVANLLPAALEAHEARVPLLLLTADRPAELRGTRSNQTTRQAGLFDAVARLSRDIDVDAAMADRTGPVGALAASDPGVATASATDDPGVATGPGALAELAWAASLGEPGGAPAGPVQLNLQFREPLSGPPGDDAARRIFAGLAASRDPEPGAEPADALPAALRPGGRTERANDPAELPATEVYLHDGDALAVVVAGEGAGAEAEAFAHAAGLPLLAEAVSGARFGREAITAYATLLDDPAVGALTERAVVFGHPTLTRQIPALLGRDDVEVIVVDPHAGDGVEYYDPSGGARVVRAARIAEGYEPRIMRRWLGAWVVPDRELRAQRSTAHEPDFSAATETGYRERNAYARAELAALREPVSREMLAESVWRASWPHDRLVLAASRLVRALDALAAPRRVEVRSNRGLAGIDGTVATALGIAAASQADGAAGVTRVLIGDLALLHDVGSLLLPAGEPRPRIQLFVGNDGGGSIFDTLEAAGSAPADAFDRVMFTPQRVDFAALAAAYGWEHLRVETRGELDALLIAPVAGPVLVEIPIAR